MLLVKRHDRRVRTAAGLAEEHRFIAHQPLRARRCPRYGARGRERSAVTLGEATYEVHRQAPGEDLYRDRLSWTPFRSLAHAHAAGVSLARLHARPLGYDAPPRAVQPWSPASASCRRPIRW
jgi:hypothetical protein